MEEIDFLFFIPQIMCLKLYCYIVTLLTKMGEKLHTAALTITRKRLCLNRKKLLESLHFLLVLQADTGVRKTLIPVLWITFCPLERL